METNHLPTIDWNKTQPGLCCPEFDPKTWDGLDLHFRDKLFVRTETRCLIHFPVNMGSVFARIWNKIKEAHADEEEFAVLSHDSSAWRSEHLFNVSHEVPGVENVRLTGDYLTHVFEGPYRDIPEWVREMGEIVKARGKAMGKLYFYYTTCPKCAKARGKNYLVGIAELNG